MKPLALLGAGLLAAAPHVLLAQDEGSVVVTATRVPQPSLDIPASVDRVYSDQIRNARPQVNLSEDLGLVPGIIVNNRQNYAQDLQVSSRGFGARSTFGIRGIRLIEDGIPATMPDGQGQASTFDLTTASSIEVLRGPFSSLYGNASGGVIVVNTEDPPPQPMLRGGLFAGSYGMRRGFVQFGDSGRRFGGIGSLSHFETDGYRDHSAAKRDQINAKLVSRLNDDTSLTIVENSLRQPDTQDPQGLTRQLYEQDPRQVVTPTLLYNTRKSVSQDQAGTTLHHRLGGGSEIAATVYGGQRSVVQYLSIPLSVQTSSPTQSGGVVDIDRTYQGGSLRYTALPGQGLRVSVGAEYARMDDHRRGFINDFGVQGALRRDENDIVASTDFYAQGEWDFAPRWALHLGARHSNVAFDVKDHYIVTGNPDDSGSKTYTATTPVAGLLYHASKTVSLYANLGEGFETPTFTEVAYLPGGGSGLNFNLKASHSTNAEIGAKAVFSVVRVNAALFEIHTRDEIVVDTNSGGRTTYKNATKTRRQGYEIGAETLLDGPWSAAIAISHLEAQFSETFTSGTSTVPEGNVLPGVPRDQIYAELAWSKPAYYARLESLSRSRIAVDDKNSDFASGFHVYNAVAGLVQKKDGWRLTEFVRVDNFTDRKYAGSVVVNDGNSRFFEPAPGRNYLIGVQGSYTF